jgi:hypothetical protein
MWQLGECQASLVELLEEKGILTQEEYEKRVKEKVTIK